MNPPPTCGLKNYGRNIVIYNAFNGTVYGGSQSLRRVKQVIKTNGFYPECTYKLELDLPNKTFGMELNGEKIMIDSNIGDYDYSPVVMFGDTGSIEAMLL